MVSGIMVIVGGIMVKNPNKRMIGGILIIVFSILSLFGAWGGFLIGMILGIIGGILGIISKPSSAATTATATPAQ
jgi:hypothetical protein